MFQSELIRDMQLSPIRAMTREANKRNAVNLGQGICDLPTPMPIQDATKAAIARSESIYSYPEGILPLREAISEKLARDNGITANPEGEIVVTAGSAAAFVSTICGLLNKGDGVLLFEPYYGYHVGALRASGLVPQFVSTTGNEFSFSADTLKDAMDESTRAIVVCTPGNPSGKMFSRQELELVAQVAEEKNLLVITDEIYEYIRYEGREHLSPATIPGLKDRTVTIMGLSKTFAITGWRLGYAVATPELAQRIRLIHDLYYICAPTPLQHGVVAGFRMGDEYFQEIAPFYQTRRDILCGALTTVGLTPIVPQGAYYVLANISRVPGASAQEKCMHLLQQAGVACIPGNAFFSGSSGDELARFCFAKELDVLEQACQRLLTWGT